MKGYILLFYFLIFVWCETWSLELREERRVGVFANRMFRKIFEPERDEVTGSGENYIRRSLMICTPRPIFFE